MSGGIEPQQKPGRIGVRPDRDEQRCTCRYGCGRSRFANRDACAPTPAGNYCSPSAFKESDDVKNRQWRAVMNFMHWRAAFAALIISSPVLAHDNGQFTEIPDTVRAWFKAVKSPHGVPCCDIADGHRTDFDMRENQYWVPINGKWLPVPAEAVVKEDGNPIGDAVVWYSIFSDQVFIRCFVPGGGA